MKEVCVVVPVGPAETIASPLFERLRILPESWQLVLVFCPQSKHLWPHLDLPDHAEAITATRGRAQQMNAGAKRIDARFLWFLHADSQLESRHISALQSVLQSGLEHLLCFELAFCTDGTGPMSVNAIGANLRTRWLGVPFGDQAFCIPAALFKKVGGYPEDVPYGEDHVFVWRLKLIGVGVTMVPLPLFTSASKYKTKGWLHLTCLYQWYWLKQAAPYAARVILKRLVRS